MRFGREHGCRDAGGQLHRIDRQFRRHRRPGAGRFSVGIQFRVVVQVSIWLQFGNGPPRGHIGLGHRGRHASQRYDHDSQNRHGPSAGRWRPIRAGLQNGHKRAELVGE